MNDSSWASLCRSALDLATMQLAAERELFHLVLNEMTATPALALHASAAVTSVCLSKVSAFENEPVSETITRLDVSGGDPTASTFTADALALLYAYDAGGQQPGTLSTAISHDLNRPAPVITVLTSISVEMMNLLAAFASVGTNTVLAALRSQIEAALPSPHQ